MGRDKARSLIEFLREETSYFKQKAANLAYEEYASNKDLKKILNATLNELVLAVVDLAGEVLKIERKRIPDTYKDIILSSREAVGDVALRAAPLAKLRNETIHEYMNLNWKNIQYLRTTGLAVVEEYLGAVERFLAQQKQTNSSTQ